MLHGCWLENPSLGIDQRNSEPIDEKAGPQFFGRDHASGAQTLDMCHPLPIEYACRRDPRSSSDPTRYENLGWSGTACPPFQKKRGNRRSFLREIAFGRVPPSLPVPIPRIGKIALDAMQPGMYPCAFLARILLGDVVSGLPFPAQPVPHGPEQRDGNCRRIAGLHVVKKVATSAFMTWSLRN